MGVHETRLVQQLEVRMTVRHVRRGKGLDVSVYKQSRGEGKYYAVVSGKLMDAVTGQELTGFDLDNVKRDLARVAPNEIESITYSDRAAEHG